jgi:hypothetical protein
LPRRRFFKSLNSKLTFIGALVIAITVSLFFFNSLSIQALLVLGNFGALTALVLWGRQKRNDSPNDSCTNDGRWTKTKVELEKIEKKLGKTKDPLKRRSLIRQRDSLENELRSLEWAIREANMNRMYNAEKGGLRNSNDIPKTPKGPNDLKSNPSTIANRAGIFDPLDRLGARAAIRRRAELEIENKERQTLLKTLDNAEAVVASEPAASLAEALQPIANDCKAHYHLIKKKRNNERTNSSILGDYWIAWSLVLSVQNRLPFDSSITKYASKDFKSRATKFMKSVDAIRYSKNESVPYTQNGGPLDIASKTGFESANNSYHSND